ncbi:hypothetical protein [Burkholderia gladioli]|uniref:hypothetical protein n=1 Tax=Burkholderia gladioli TaxID=28095 RepID=UPI000BBD384C|nr:hypothetical protein [Burkholderia gladioli]ATF90536.1 hypothetical protein CO712_36240 [Burkholderia gladioli pv. gladioli]MBJ9711334.1 hypothetical protein [Burkholderia gladioli]MDN7499608.1 hypothetical protein [Burkholderia gladioli]MDR8086130.1 hypothetical protein [Burkholderia gladioli]MDZ4041432.1 hypothetical protein [Burkholderia gladioli pv. alliicola]
MKQLQTALFISIVAASINAHAAHPRNEFEGAWVVQDVVGYSDTSGGLPEAKRLLGETIKIAKDRIDFDGQRCQPSDGFTISTVDTAPKLLDYYQIDVTDAGLPNKTLLLDSASCAPIFRMDARRIVFGWDGVILRAIKQ